LRKIIIIITGIAFCLTACKDKKVIPQGLLNKEQMEKVLSDVMDAEAFTNNYIKKDSTKNLALENAKLQHQVFALHQVTKDQFYSSFDYYRKHPELMSEILDSISVMNMRTHPTQSNTSSSGSRSLNRHFPNERMPFFRDSAARAKFNHNPVQVKP
jgi:hypothetical protein